MASGYPATITVRNLKNEGRPVNAKSILSVLTLGVGKGDTIAIEAEGEQADEALNALVELVRSNFGEEAH
jgi:phosphocarrier protein